MNVKKRPLSLSNDNFTTLRSNNEIYVDKTELVAKLASERSGRYFLSRPRRFGKSLLLSTFESLFRYGLRDFDGLAIEKCWSDKETYDVLRLDFSLISEATNPNELSEYANDMLEYSCLRAGIEIPAAGSFVYKFLQILNRYQNKKLVLLIDEYDSPLAHHLHEPQSFLMHQRFLGRIFQYIKSSTSNLRFFLLTGIAKFGNSSIFSSVNFLRDITYNQEYNALLGLTERELLHYYYEHLSSIEERLSISHEDLIKALRDYYDGYCFSKKTSERIYNPWSILSFLDNPDPDFPNYWYKSGGEPSILKNYLQLHDLSNPDAFFEPKRISQTEFEMSYSFDAIGELSLLQQTGYLTIDQYDGKDVVLKYPNLEVAESLASLYSKALLKGKTVNQIGGSNVREIFQTGTVRQVIDIFNKILLNIPYDRHVLENEYQCRNSVALILFGAGLRPEMEKHNLIGRSDMEVCIGNRHWVFEFKFSKDEARAAALLDAAVDQIKIKRYGEGELDGRELIRVAAVFSARKREIILWDVVDPHV